jgi:hypothetical protein
LFAHDVGWLDHGPGVVQHLPGALATTAMGAAVVAVSLVRWWSIFVVVPALAAACLLTVRADGERARRG